jgi:hypothetical protein
MSSNLAQQYFSKLFIAQVVPGQNQHVLGAKWSDAHGDRVRLRIPGKHPKANEIIDDDLPWGIVSKTTSSGNLNNTSCALWGGEWVICCYMDESEQIPIVLHVIANNISEYSIRESEDGTTNFKRVDRFNNGLTVGTNLIMGSPKNNATKSIPRRLFDQATKKR